MANSKVYRYSAGWVEETQWVKLKVVDTIDYSRYAEILISDPLNTKQNTAYSPFQGIYITEYSRNEIIFYGMIEYIESKYDESYGQVLMLQCKDNLGLLEGRICDGFFCGAATRGALVQRIVNYYDYNDLRIDTHVPPPCFRDGDREYLTTAAGDSAVVEYAVYDFTVAAGAGNYVAGEQVQGATSGATAYVKAWVAGTNTLTVHYLATANFQIAENIVGLGFGATRALNAIALNSEYLVISGVLGTFNNNEAITGSESLATALVNIGIYNKRLDASGIPATTAISATTGDYEGSRISALDAVRQIAADDNRDFFVSNAIPAVVTYFTRGSRPAVPVFTNGLTIAYNESEGLQTKAVHADYKFPIATKEFCTHVIGRGRDDNEEIVQVVKSRGEIASSYKTFREKLYEQQGLGTTVDVTTMVNDTLTDLDTPLIQRGTVAISGYPVYRIALTNYTVRAGELVHIHNSNVSTIHETDMYVIQITYEEPPGIAEISLLGTAAGRGCPDYKLEHILQNVARSADEGRWRSAGSQGIGLDSRAPDKPVGLAAQSLYAGVLLTWTANTEKDLDYYKIYRNTVNNFSTSVNIGRAKATYYLDEDTALVLGATYYYWVSAIDLSGNENTVGLVSVNAVPRQLGTADIANESITNALLKAGARPYNATMTFEGTAWNAIRWYGPAGVGNDGNIEFADGTVRTLDFGTLIGMTASTTYYLYIDVSGVGHLVVQNSTDYTVPFSDTNVLLAIVAVAANATYGDAPLIFPFCSKSPTLNAVVICANAIMTNHLQALSVIADKLAVNSVTAGKLEADLILATIIRTAAAGARVEMVGSGVDGIFGYDAGNNLQFGLYASTGKAYCGAGAVILDASGILIKGNYLTFQTAGGVHPWSIGMLLDGAYYMLGMFPTAGDKLYLPNDLWFALDKEIGLYYDTSQELFFRTKNKSGAANIDHRLCPSTAGSDSMGWGYLGDGTYWWYGIYSQYFYYKVAPASFQEEDDVALVKAMKPALTKFKDKNGKERHLLDMASIPAKCKVKEPRSDDPSRMEEFIDAAALTGLLIGAIKQLSEKIELLESRTGG